MNAEKIGQFIREGKASLGIELGSTRIKAVLVGEDYAPIAQGAHDWENRLEDGVWTYHLDDVWAGIQNAYVQLAADVQSRYGVPLQKLAGLGFSAMMHGYLPFDKDGKQLAGFRTWRNTTTEQAAALLTKAFRFNVPQRWSVAHLYQAVLNGEEHVAHIATLTTLAGYVHWQLTGRKVLGVGDASGMFPIDSKTNDYDAAMMQQFNALVAGKNYPWRLADILPKALCAGEDAGTLTEAGARLLDKSGVLQPGVPVAPPEGDAGTGMTATNSVAPRTGNVSAGTSVFAMAVLEQPLTQVYTEIDMVTTPTGMPVAMVHCNNCSSDLDAWVRLFAEVIDAAGADLPRPKLYDLFYEKAMAGEADGGGLLSYNYYSGEPITGLDEGRPLFVRLPGSRMTLANFARTILLSTMGTLRIGMEILTGQEHVKLERMLGHGGLFKTPVVGQQLMAAALQVPMTVMASAGEGGPWGMALLAAYRAQKQPCETLESFLAQRVFAADAGSTIAPQPQDVAGFDTYMQRYRAGLPIQRAAVENLR